MSAEDKTGKGPNESGIVYERGLVTSKKWMAGTNAGGIFLSDFFEVPMGIKESVANSRLGQALVGLANVVKPS